MLPIVMFDRFLTLFKGARAERPGDACLDPLHRAAAVLLVIAAQLDGRMDDGERTKIEWLLETRLKVADAGMLVDEADRAAASSTDFFGVTRIIKDRLDLDQRAAVIEMLWEVVLSDGVVHDYEANLVRRIAGLLHVSDRHAGEARKRVVEGQKE